MASVQTDTSVNSSSSSSFLFPLESYKMKVANSLFTAFFISYLLLLPLFIFVLYVGYQRWRKQRSVSTAVMTSHSDIFTFNMVVMEIVCVLGSCFFCYGAYTNHQTGMTVGLYTYFIISPGQILFHLLTCVDRYLAVVHPVTYLGLRQAGGVRIRNISAGCVWLLCFGSPGLSHISLLFGIIYIFLLLVLSAIVISVCSISVLCVLIRPGPGEVGGNRERVDQSKQRAFHTIMAIMAALISRLLINLVYTVISVACASVLSGTDMLIVVWAAGWFYLPSSLVLPLLFLHRAGKLPACKHNSVSA